MNDVFKNFWSETATTAATFDFPKPASLEYFNKIKPSLWILPQGALYFGPLPVNKLHSHRAVQILISPSKDLKIDQGPKKNLISGQAAFIPPFIEHRVGTHWKFAFSFFYDDQPGDLLPLTLLTIRSQAAFE